MAAQTTGAVETTGTSTWQIDPAHAEVGFAVKHLMISTVRGKFTRVQGTVELDEADPTRSTAEIEIDASSIDTREEKRDAHLRSADFLDVENEPKLLFRTTRVERAGDGKYRATGDLTIRGVTREVVLDVTDAGRVTSPWGQEVAAFRATTSIDRRDFGLEWNQALETGGFVVGNEVHITIEVEAIKQS